jgi:transmembrane sensor
MPIKRIAFLVKKKLDKTATDSEVSELSQLFLNVDAAELDAALKPIWEEYEASHLMPIDQSDELLAKILQTPARLKPETSQPIYFRNWIKYAAAAILLFALVSSSYLFYFKNDKAKTTIVKYKGDVAPGIEGAKLRLSDGRSIMIDSIKDGLVAVDGTVKIFKEQGKLLYRGTSDGTFYNEITTELGRQWSAVLPDGTIVWLNASSTLRYPLKFATNERLVEMQGEAAFKVVHNSKQPFRVKVGKQIIEDIGTEFNVKAYSDETEIKTTLIEGSASITTNLSKTVIKAGELSSVNVSTQKNTLSKADLDIASAWRNGLFSFKDADIKTVMKDIARWYNVEVKYEGRVSELPDFSGKMGRNLTLKQVMKVLSIMRVQFRIEEDKRIVIMP